MHWALTTSTVKNSEFAKITIEFNKIEVSLGYYFILIRI